MISRLRALLLAGAIAACGQAAQAEPIALGDALAQGVQTSPRAAQAKALGKLAGGEGFGLGHASLPSARLRIRKRMRLSR